MVVFIVRRIIQAVLVMLVISIIGFGIKQAVGDPVRDLVGVSVSAKEREKLADKLGLNDPLPVQWVRFMANALKGDLGHSSYFKRPALEVILEKAPATLELVFVSSLLILIISIPVGIYSAVYPGSLLARGLMGLSAIGVSIPVFLTAIMLIHIFATMLDWLPSFGRGDTVLILGFWDSGLFTLDGLLHLILPSIALSSVMLPLFVRLVRAEMKEVLEAEYIKYAKAKGLHPWRVLFVHAFKNTLLPVITVGGLQLGTMIAFTVLTETVFQWQGMGFIFLEAVQRADTALLIAYLVFVGAVFVFVNTLVDIVYGVVNPVVRVSGRS